MTNKLFCTFSSLQNLEETLEEILTSYTILYGKVFVLYIKETDEYVCTYNVDPDSVDEILPNTILVHRKKESNTLYTINVLNELIKSLNGGVVDTRYRIDWKHYRNSIMLTQKNELKLLKTKIYTIINL
jgi:hypothetical protein